MYYEETILDGLFYYRTSPNGDWLPISEQEITRRLIQEKAANAAMKAALCEYANPNNWEAKEDDVMRHWMEPNSGTRDAYDGFDIARAALAKAGAA